MPRSPKAAVPPRPPPEPLEVNAVLVVAIGVALWFGGLCVLLVLRLARGAAAETGHREWLWTSLAGWLLGMLGLYLTWRRQRG